MFLNLYMIQRMYVIQRMFHGSQVSDLQPTLLSDTTPLIALGSLTGILSRNWIQLLLILFFLLVTSLSGIQVERVQP